MSWGDLVINIPSWVYFGKVKYRLSSPLSVTALRSTQESFREEKILSLGADVPQDTPGLHRKWFIQEASAAAGYGASPAII